MRAALLSGDERSLYLGWLASVQAGELDDDDIEPPIPAGMQRLTGPLEALADFLYIDPDLLATAAELSLLAVQPREEKFVDWLTKLPAGEKDDLLVAFCSDEQPHLATKLRRRFKESTSSVADAVPGGRTIGQLLARAGVLRERREEEEHRKAEKARAKRKADEARKRQAELDDLSRRGEAPWNEVHTQIESKQASAYDRAIAILKDLHDLAERSGTLDAFSARIATIHETHSKKPSFIKRLRRVGIISDKAAPH